MAERATLRFDTGVEVRVEVVETSPDGEELVVRTTSDDAPEPTVADFLAVIDEHLASVTPRPSGTTDRLLAADRGRPY